MLRNPTNGRNFMLIATGCLLAASLLPPTMAAGAEGPPVLPSLRYGIDLTGRVAPLRLEAVDHQSLLLEDQMDMAANGIGPLRIGILRPIALFGMSDPVVLDVIPNVGLIWTAGYRSVKAEGLRLHLSGLDLPAGAEIWFFNPDHPEAAEGPFGGKGVRDTGHLWSGIFGGDTIYVQYFVPASAEHTGYFVVEELGHIYRPLNPVIDDAGWCQKDILCYPNWHPLHEATTKISMIKPPYLYECSATQLATTAKDETPLLLTANHCVENQQVGDTLTVLFFYEHYVCNQPLINYGTPVLSPDPIVLATTPYLTSGGADQTLMMVEGVIPAGTQWAPWSISAFPDGEIAVSISHPAGDYKRYAKGTKIQHPFGDPNQYYGVGWTEGTIEPGSSGGGLYRESNKLLYGVCSHTAVGTGCDQQYGPSGYGKLSAFYSKIYTYLPKGSDDNLEPNQPCASARVVATGNYPNLVVKSTDLDWYKFTLGTNGKLDVTLNFLNRHGNIDMKLYRGCGGPVVASSASFTDVEQISYTNTGGADDFFLNVYLANDVRNTYNMTVTAAFRKGDLDCNGAVNNFDIDPFVLALTDPAGYKIKYPICDVMLGDMNGDGQVNNFDIDPFVACLTDPNKCP